MDRLDASQAVETEIAVQIIVQRQGPPPLVWMDLPGQAGDDG